MNKDIFFKIVILFSVLLVFNHCEKKCSGFNEDILYWLPYSISDTIELYKGDTMRTLILTEHYINHTDHIGKYSKCECVNEYVVKLQFDTNIISVFYNTADDPENSYVTINKYLGNFIPQPIVNHFELNGEFYDNVIVYYSLNPYKKYLIQQIIISKSYGIIAIYDSEGNWYIKNKKTRQLKTTDININSGGC